MRPLDLKTALQQQEGLTELGDARQLVVKTATLEEAIEEWTPSVGAGASAVRALGDHLGLQGRAALEPRDADAALLLREDATPADESPRNHPKAKFAEFFSHALG